MKENPIFNEERELVEENRESPKGDVFKRIKSKLMAMAMAGLITLGSIQESSANQMNFEKKSEAGVELKLEPAVTEEKLRNFEEQLKREDPEFLEWAARYEAKMAEEIDGVSEAILNPDPDQDRQIENKLKKLKYNNTDKVFDEDHRVLEFFHGRPDELKKYQGIIKDNMHSIVMATALIDRSPAVRKKLSSLEEFPELTMDVHNNSELLGVNGYTDERARVYMTPRVFLGPDRKVSIDGYVNFMVHELFLHGLQSSGGDPRFKGSSVSDFRDTLIEGVTQNGTYEIIQYLQSKNPELKSVLGHDLYDERIIAAIILDAISKSHGSGDSLARWSSALISDADLIEEIKQAADDLGLDPGMADDMKKFTVNPEYFLQGSGDPPLYLDKNLKLTINLLARLQNSGLSISPDMIRNIFMNGRTIDQVQIKKLDELTRHWKVFLKGKNKDIRKTAGR